MTRKELATEVNKIIREDFGNEFSQKDIWKRIAETSDDELYKFYCERRKKDDCLQIV